MFAICQALMLYTHGWGLFFGVGTVLALIPVWRASDDRRGLVRDAVLRVTLAPDILFLPWLPNFIYQATHTGAPWAPTITLRRSRPALSGSARRATASRWRCSSRSSSGSTPFFTKRGRGTREGAVMWSIIFLLFGTLIVAWLASQITPAFVARYMAPILASILLLAAWGASPVWGVVGLVTIALCVVFVVHPLLLRPAVQERHARHRRRDEAADSPRTQWCSTRSPTRPRWLGTTCRAGLHYVTSIGPVDDPSYMDWVYALKRLYQCQPRDDARSSWLEPQARPAVAVRATADRGHPRLEGALGTPGPAARGAVGADPPGRRSTREVLKPIATGAATDYRRRPSIP